MHLAIICLFTGCTIFAQNIDVQPIPQQVSKQDGQINLPETYQLLGETEANPYAVQELKDLLGAYENFELTEPFQSGQSYIFGITQWKTPGQYRFAHLYRRKRRQVHPQVYSSDPQPKGRLLSIHQ